MFDSRIGSTVWKTKFRCREVEETGNEKSREEREQGKWKIGHKTRVTVLSNSEILLLVVVVCNLSSYGFNIK